MKDIEKSFIHTIQQGRLVHAYLFEGMRGSGKAETAIFIAKSLFCQNPKEDGLPCQVCDTCRRIDAGNFVDLVEVRPDGQSIKVDQIRELRQTLSRSGMESNYRVCIIHDADKMTVGASNSLLKFLEEPEENVYLFLLTENLRMILATIQSRCQIVRFHGVPKTVFIKELEKERIPFKKANFLSYVTNSLSQAVEWARDEHFLDIQTASWMWFDLWMTNRQQAFVEVQTRLVPIINSKEDAQLFLEMLQFYCRDTLLVSFGKVDQLVEGDKESYYQKLLKKYPVQVFIDFTKEISQAMQRIQANVGIQATLELLTISGVLT